MISQKFYALSPTKRMEDTSDLIQKPILLDQFINVKVAINNLECLLLLADIFQNVTKRKNILARLLIKSGLNKKGKDFTFKILIVHQRMK